MSLASLRCPPTASASPVIPSTITRKTPIPIPISASISSAAPIPRGTRCPFIQATNGDPTAATIAATSTGTTITWVSAASAIAPVISSATPTSSHDISPMSRSHPGTLIAFVSSPGSISM